MDELVRRVSRRSHSRPIGYFLHARASKGSSCALDEKLAYLACPLTCPTMCAVAAGQETHGRRNNRRQDEGKGHLISMAFLRNAQVI